MGNRCFGRVDEPESPRDSNSRSANTSDTNNTTRLRHPSLRQRNLIHEYYLPQYDNDPIFHPAPGVSRPMSQLTEEEQILIAKRLGLLSTLPMFIFDESKKEKFIECIICMCEYIEGEECRHLPCLHTFHRKCIDDWLIRSFTCPSCLEQVDTVLLSSQNNNKKSYDNGGGIDSVSKKHRKRRTVSNVETYASGTTVTVGGGDNSNMSDSNTTRVSRQHSRTSNKSNRIEYRSATSQDISCSTTVSRPTMTPPTTATNDIQVILPPLIPLHYNITNTDCNEPTSPTNTINTSSGSSIAMAGGTITSCGITGNGGGGMISSPPASLNDDSNSASALLLHDS